MSIQLKQEHDTVKELHGVSGFGWDPVKMHVTASHEVWQEYCKVSTTAYMLLHLHRPQKHPKAAPFRKKGFPLFVEIGDLIDGSRATGEFAFRVGEASGPSHTQQSPIPSPSEDPYDIPIDPVLLGISHNTDNTRDANSSRVTA
jgi:Myb/SANT-like DNA-binding domain